MHSASLRLSVISENNMQVTNDPYDYYNNGFKNGPESQHFENETVNKKQGKFIALGTEYERKKSFDTAKLDNSSDEFSRSFYSKYERNLHVGLSQSSLTQQRNNSNQYGYVAIWILQNTSGAGSLLPNEENCLQHEHAECHKGDSKWVLSGDETPHKIIQDDILNQTTTRVSDREAIVDVTANQHNHWNREIHDCLWCPCILYFMFICCIPALLFMYQSDVAFRKGRDSMARYYAMCSSLFYVIGLMLSLGFYAMIVALVVIFAK